MALSFNKIISKNDNDSIDHLFFESVVQGNLYSSANSYKPPEDPLLFVPNENVSSEDEDTDDCILELEDLEKSWECDISDSLEFDSINISDFDSYQSHIPSINNIACDNSCIEDNDHFITNKISLDDSNKNSSTTRRQSSRIENLTRKKIAEQIQRENIRLAMEAQFLNNRVYQRKRKQSCNGRVVISEMSNDTNEDFVDNVDTYSEDDPNKVYCLCRKPYGKRFMICCDNCLEWYHGDCVGVTEEEGTDMDEFTCPLCEANLSANIIPDKSDKAVVEEDEEDDDHELLEEVHNDCLITKSIEPMQFNANIFQLFKQNQESEPEPDKSKVEAPVMNLPLLSARTSVCLNQTCKTLVNPKKSLYCCRTCINKYIKMVIKNNLREKAKQYGLQKGPKLAKMTRFVLAQPATDTIQNEFDAPTEDTLKEFLIRNPTFKVYQSAKPIKTKADLEKSKKFWELINRDPSKQIKIVKHFATLFKKFMTVKLFNVEFRNIWQNCVEIEKGLFESCDKVINEKYLSKVKELSYYLKSQENDRLFLDIIHNKLTISNLLSMTKDQLDSRSMITVTYDQLNISLNNSELLKKCSVISQSSISLLSDTTHLHSHHLYDINCKICNGAQKPLTYSKQDKEALLSLDNAVSSCTDLINSEKVGSPSNNDEDAVTSSVEIPDLGVDMEICSPSSEIDESDSRINNNDSNVDSSVVEHNTIIESKNVVQPVKRKLTSLWEGTITYKEVGSVMCKSYLVTRFFLNKSIDKEKLPEKDNDVRELLHISSSVNSEIIISGRSQLSEIQKYLRRLRKHSNKEFLVMRLHPSNLDDGGKIYQSMFEFLHGKERCGVINDKRMGVKDCFIYPLNAHVKIPSIFLPFVGSGLEKRRPHLLLLILVRTPLSHIQYQPISPKYDHDDDFVKRHGINLDKYCLPNQNVSYCPFPIINSNDGIRWVINTKLKDDEKNPIKINNFTDKHEIKSNNAELNNGNGIKIHGDLEKTPSDKLCIEHFTDSKNETQNSKQSQNEYVDKLKAINSENNVVSTNDKEAATDVPIIKLCDIPLPDTIPDIIKKSSVKKKLPPTTKVLSSPTALDLSLRPTPFVYRSLVKQSSNIKQIKDDESNPPTDDCDIVKVTLGQLCTPNTTEDNDTLKSDTDAGCIGDLDLRFNFQDNQEDECKEEYDTFHSLFLKRKDSSRLYTLYDSEIKRRYFFNPFSPKRDFVPSNKEILPSLIDIYKEDDIKVNSSCLPLNASVFSPQNTTRNTGTSSIVFI